MQRAVSDFVPDVEAATGVRPELRNVTVAGSSFSSDSHDPSSSSRAIIVSTLGKLLLVEQVVNKTGLDVSAVKGRLVYGSSRVKLNGALKCSLSHTGRVSRRVPAVIARSSIKPLDPSAASVSVALPTSSPNTVPSS